MNSDQAKNATKTRFIAAALIDRGDSYLFIRQAKADGAYPDMLHIPGGGVEPGETPEEAVRREIKEEVDLVVDNVMKIDFSWDCVFYKGEQTVLVFLRFLAKVPSDAKPRASSDAKEVVWIRKEDVRMGNHNPATLELLNVIGAI